MGGVKTSRTASFGALATPIVGLVLVLGLASCSGSPATPGGKGGATTAPAVNIAMTPASGATNIAPATPVTVHLTDGAAGTLSTVTVKSSKGDQVSGTIAGGSWTSKGKLAFGATYTVQAAAAGKPLTTVGTFTTTPTPSGDASVHASSFNGDGAAYGIGMPLILKLDSGLTSKEQRAAFEKALKVTTQPASTGAWGWISSKEVHFRPQQYWSAGTKIHLDVETAGVQLGDKWGRTDITVDFKIGRDQRLTADASSHRLVMTVGGKQVKNLPVSLGSPKHPSSSGTLLIIEKRPTAVFDSGTYGVPASAPGGYKTNVNDVERLTWGGEFIHSAPWSVGQQGNSNVSHGCINVAPGEADWLFRNLQVGDPVVVRNTNSPVKAYDGWTDWTLSWDQWLTKSAAGPQSTAA
jgi:lipoprotein-anchoring transpeptidase ErfK/SrfK